MIKRITYWISRYLMAGGAIYLVFELPNIGIEDWPVLVVMIVFGVITTATER